MANLETDYLIVGAGAVGLAFADTLFDEDSDAHITIVDKRAKPGGNWNDAYPFVALHQPSATYGVNSMELCSDRMDEHGHNAGMFPLASKAEILAYYGRLMNDKLIPSGRVCYFPLSEYQDGHRIGGILSGNETKVEVRRKLVDATYFETSIPATHERKFAVADDARLVIPGDLPKLTHRPADIPDHYVILGGGKTAMDACIWLIQAGVSADRIGWVRPRDSWVVNRKFIQPGAEFFEQTLQFQIGQLESAASSETGDQMFGKLEKLEIMLRIDPKIKPEMFHLAVLSEGEVEMLARIKQVYRRGHVTAVERAKLHFKDHSEPVPENSLFVDCTASAVRFTARNDDRPVFSKDRIIVKPYMVPWITHSAAMAAFIEANFDEDEEKNALALSGPVTDTPNSYPAVIMRNVMNIQLWAQNPKMSAWESQSRLNPIAPTVAKLMAENSPKLATLATLFAAMEASMPGVIKLGTKALAEHQTG